MTHFNIVQMNRTSIELGAFVSEANYALEASSDRKHTTVM